MTRLFLILFSMISASLMGGGIAIALTIGFDTLRPIFASAAIGFVLAVPVSVIIARRLA